MMIDSFIRYFVQESNQTGVDAGELASQFWQEQDDEMAASSQHLTEYWFSRPQALLEYLRLGLIYESECPLTSAWPIEFKRGASCYWQMNSNPDRHPDGYVHDWAMSWEEEGAQPVRAITVFVNQRWKIGGDLVTEIHGLLMDDEGNIRHYWFIERRWEGGYWEPPDGEEEFIWCAGLLRRAAVVLKMSKCQDCEAEGYQECYPPWDSANAFDGCGNPVYAEVTCPTCSGLGYVLCHQQRTKARRSLTAQVCNLS